MFAYNFSWSGQSADNLAWCSNNSQPSYAHPILACIVPPRSLHFFFVKSLNFQLARHLLHQDFRREFSKLAMQKLHLDAHIAIKYFYCVNNRVIQYLSTLSKRSIKEVTERYQALTGMNQSLVCASFTWHGVVTLRWAVGIKLDVIEEN